MKRSRLTAVERAEILQLRAAGLRPRTIAGIIGVHRNVASRVATEAGFPHWVSRQHIPDWRRFWSFLEEAPDTGCWIWQGGMSDGYGVFKWTVDAAPNRGVKAQALAHRWAYEFLVAPIPPGLHLDHLCRVPACVNPYHLEPVTAAVNTRRAGPANKTHCVRGHEYTPENTHRSPTGRRTCRSCWSARRAEQRAVVGQSAVTPRA